MNISEPVSEQASEIIFNLGQAIWAAAIGLAGARGKQHTPSDKRNQREFDRMSNPRPGDLVIEISTLSARFDPDRVAVLVSGSGEVGRRCEVRPLHRADLITWDNAQFIALPNEASWNNWLTAE